MLTGKQWKDDWEPSGVRRRSFFFFNNRKLEFNWKIAQMLYSFHFFSVAFALFTYYICYDKVWIEIRIVRCVSVCFW